MFKNLRMIFLLNPTGKGDFRQHGGGIISWELCLKDGLLSLVSWW
jgi:hypothetical protein